MRSVKSGSPVVAFIGKMSFGCTCRGSLGGKVVSTVISDEFNACESVPNDVTSAGTQIGREANREGSHSSRYRSLAPFSSLWTRGYGFFTHT